MNFAFVPRLLVLGFVVFGMGQVAYAEESDEATTITEVVWSGEVELGAVVTTGNTEQENLKFRLGATREGEVINQTAQFDGLRSSESNVVTAEKYYAFYQADYKLNEVSSVFGRLAYEQDEFSGYNYQTDATAGYSRTFVDDGVHKWTGDLGAGTRYSEFDTGQTDSEFIVRVATAYTWQISEHSRFRQHLSVEIGEESTITRSETSIQANIAGSLAMKAAIQVKHQSEVPIGRENTDTESSITLVYAF